MSSSLLRLPPPLSPTPAPSPLPLPGRVLIRVSNPSLRPARTNPITARDRGKNRKPIQRGRYLSIEAIQAVQSLKRAKINGGDSVGRVMESKVQRLVKRDMVAALKELQSQGEGVLAFRVSTRITCNLFNCFGLFMLSCCNYAK